MSQIRNNSTIYNNTNTNDNTDLNPIDITININNSPNDLGPNLNNNMYGRNNNDLTGFRYTSQNNMNNFENINEQSSFNIPPYDNRYMQFRDPNPDNIGFRGGQVMQQQQQFYGNFDSMLNNPDIFGNPSKMGQDMFNNNMHGNQPNQNFDEFSNFGPKTRQYSNNNTNNLNNDIPIFQKNMNLKGLETCSYLSHVGASIIQVQIKKILDNIINKKELKIDYSENKKNKYEFFGRVFTSQESHFTINIYKLEEKDNKNNVSMIQIRKIYGNEGFGFNDLEKLVAEKLRNKNTILKEEPNEMINDFLESLTLDDDDEEDMEDDPYQDLDDTNNNNLSLDNDKEFDSNLCEIMLETLYNKKSFREEYMHDAYQLASYLEKNDNRSKNMLNYIVKNESETIIENILEAINSENLYCAFIILYSLDIIYLLVSNEDIKSQLKFPKSFQKDINEIYGIWLNDEGRYNNIGNFKLNVTKSQQIVNRCQAIIDTIQNNN